MVCHECQRETADGFSFCPYCGNAVIGGSPVVESPSSASEVRPVTEVETESLALTPSIASDRTNEIGTYVFGAFSVISLLVSIIKGIVPIYLVESAIWAGAAWYWHSKKPHSERAKAVVILLAVVIVIGEVIQIASQSDSRSEHISQADPVSSSDPWSKYATPIPDSGKSAATTSTPPTGQFPTTTGDPKDTTNSEETQLKSEPKSSTETQAGLEATITCDNVVWDRDEYGDGDPIAIGNLHRGDIVQYVGHVTVSGRDIIRVHGRKGYVDGCVDVKLKQDTGNSDESRPKTESRPKNETHSGLLATVTCDAIVWDRDEYGDGDPIAIASVHRGDIVQYVGHVTVSGRDIIRVRGRKGYVEGCVDVKQ